MLEAILKGSPPVAFPISIEKKEKIDEPTVTKTKVFKPAGFASSSLSSPIIPPLIVPAISKRKNFRNQI
jgi:hypothetical protein